MVSSRKVEVLIIGGGITGVGIARDLAMRGADVLLVEKGDFAAGASGRNHGMLHSGGRYAVKDPISAKECSKENQVLKKIANYCIEDTGGLFISLSSDDPDYVGQFLNGCKKSFVPVEEVGVNEANQMEPSIAKGLNAAVLVKDASIDSFFLVIGNVMSARSFGAELHNHCKLTSLKVENGRITEAVLSTSKGIVRISPDIVVNATGPWADTVAMMASIHVPLSVDKGTMVVIDGRPVGRLINRMRPPADGDILVPHRSGCIIGTTSRRGYPGSITPLKREVKELLSQAVKAVPDIKSSRLVRAYSGARPLLSSGMEGRSTSRNFKVIDHSSDGVDNFISVVGGKLTTFRLMAEQASDIVMRKLGRKGPCRTDVESILGADAAMAASLPQYYSSIMIHKYGINSPAVAEKCMSMPRGMMPGCSCESVLLGELYYAAQDPD